MNIPHMPLNKCNLFICAYIRNQRISRLRELYHQSLDLIRGKNHHGIYFGVWKTSWFETKIRDTHTPTIALWISLCVRPASESAMMLQQRSKRNAIPHSAPALPTNSVVIESALPKD